MVLVKFIKLHEDAKLPVYATNGSACADLYSVEGKVIPANGSAIVDIGLQAAYTHPDYFYTIETRSGMGFKNGIHTHHGRIDSDYRGNLGVKLYNLSDKDYFIAKGDRIAQLELRENKRTDFEFTDKVEETGRGSGGFGHTGK